MKVKREKGEMCEGCVEVKSERGEMCGDGR